MTERESTDHTQRFSNRVADYVSHRPDYPEAVIAHLQEAGFLFPDASVADVGSGTGIFTRMLLDYGYEVYGVEPNEAMRAAAEAVSEDDARFHSIAAPAEATTLPDEEVDLVTAAQSLHWFDLEATRDEFRRITRPPHRFAAIWNRRDTRSTLFLQEYESLLQRHGIGYRELMQRRDELEANMQRFFGHPGYRTFRATHSVSHSWEGLLGRLLSSSYGPKPGHPNHELVVTRLREIFDAHATDKIAIVYETRVYYGDLLAP